MTKNRLLVAASAVAIVGALAQAARAETTTVATNGPIQMAALAAAAAAQSVTAPARAAPAPVATVDEVVITGSRIQSTGYTQPTPVTVVGEEIIQRDARPSIGDTIRQLPAVTGGSSPFTQGAGGIVAGTAGLDTVNLRQLGTGRTLILFDGQRVVQSVISGQVDIGTIPSVLVQRVDVVTGGASAAWGSDAVSGVVNLVLNKRFDGVRLSADYGDTDRWDRKSYRMSAAAGTGFAGGRGRVIVAANHVDSPDILFAGQRDWSQSRQLLLNPAYTATNAEPRYVHVNGVGLSQATTGGLIVGHVAPNGATVTTAASPFRGLQFVGPNAAIERFNFGTVQGSVSGRGSAETLNAQIDNLTVAFRSTTLFGYSSYEVTDRITASLQVNYGKSHSENSSVPNTAFGNLRIPIDNGYLPASVKADMLARGINTLIVGTTHLNNLSTDPDSWSLEAFRNTVGVPVGEYDRTLNRLVANIDWDIGDGWFGSDWTANAYYQRGRTNFYQITTNNNITANLALAIDAVAAPAGNTAGIPAGAIVCRSTLTNPTNGCVPLNIFGVGVASPAAIRYVNVTPGENFQEQWFEQDVFAATFQGALPFGLPAGDIALAFGAEHRRESGRTVPDGGAINRRYALGNFAPFEGSYKVTEGFAEVDVPLLDGVLVQQLSFNAAGRVTRYSTSGTVQTWKVGLTSQLDDNVRLRGTISRDIRAPNLNELFSQGVATTNSAVDPKTGQNVFIYTFSSGNPALQPEIGETYSGGVVLTPTFIPGFTASADIYSIEITDAIGSVSAANTLTRCNNGETRYCEQLVFAGPGGALSQINVYPLNLASQTAKGVDFQADYTLPVLQGQLSFRLLGNYIMKQTSEQFGVVTRCDGSMGVNGQCGSVPKLRSNLSATYALGPVSFTVQGRFIGKSKLALPWTSKDVDKNEVPAIGYFDLRGSFEVNEAVEVFGTIDNLLDQDPPNIPATAGSSGSGIYYATPVRGDIWDTLGRAYRIGARARF